MLLASLILLVNFLPRQLVHLLDFFLDLLLVPPRPTVKHTDLVLTLAELTLLLLKKFSVLRDLI